MMTARVRYLRSTTETERKPAQGADDVLKLLQPTLCLASRQLTASLRLSGITTLNNITTMNSSLNVSGTTILNNLTTVNSSLNVSGTTILNNITTVNSSLNVSGTTTLNNITTVNSSLNVSGTTILNNITTINSSLNVSGTTRLNNITTVNSSLNVSGTTILNNFTTINAPLYINTNQNTTVSALSINSTTTSILVNIIQNLGWNDGVNYALNVTGYSMFGGVQINGQDSNNIYKRVGDLTISSPSLSSIILKTNYGAWEAMRLNTAGTSINTSLYVSGLTIFNNATTCTSSLNVSGTTILNNSTTCLSSLNVSGITTFNNSSTNFWYNTPGTSSTNNGFNSFFSLNANLITVPGLNSQPFIRVYNRMFKNGANSAIDIKTFGNSNSNVNSDVLIRLDSGGDPTPGANAGTITYSINGSDKHIMTGSRFGINTISPICSLDVNGIACIHNGSPYAVSANFMQSGSLTIGGTNANYGVGVNQWSSNTAGLMMECADYTEICVHDASTRVASLIHYDGVFNKIVIGRNKGWGESQTQIVGNLTLPADRFIYSSDTLHSRFYFTTNGTTIYYGYGSNYDNAHVWKNGDTDTTLLRLDNLGNLTALGYISGKFLSVTKTPSDYLGVAFDTAINNSYSSTIYILFQTFTGFHRCFTEDEKFNKDDPQKFKDDYIGRIVISTGKIATDLSNDNNEWEIKYDKDGINVEDAIPMIELSRLKKDKRVFGVMGDNRRNNSRAERLIVNSVGEGGIWVCNSNSNIENGDYITSSDYLGYGEKQDDDLLHNYTVAKATMNCDFILDSPYYKCLELNDHIKIAFIACTYHCG